MCNTTTTTSTITITNDNNNPDTATIKSTVLIIFKCIAYCAIAYD